jgi:hypothetical protein
MSENPIYLAWQSNGLIGQGCLKIANGREGNEWKCPELNSRTFQKLPAWKTGVLARAQSGVRHQVQARLRLPGHARENKRNMVAGVFASGTGDDHAAALNATVIAR